MNDIQTIFALIFWFSALLLFHNYFGIYLILKVIRLFQPKEKSITTGDEVSLPSLTVLVPAHNEENFIAEKIENLLTQDYPVELLDIIIGSDNSTDRTNEIVLSYSDQGIQLREFNTRHGKQGVIDAIVPGLQTEVVVMSDANVLFAKDALYQLAKEYADPEVGSVSGELTTTLPKGGEKLRGESSYRNFENRVKYLMSQTGYLTGILGGFFSVRQKIFCPMGEHPVQDDVVVPLYISAQGYKVVHARDSRVFEETQPTITAEFRRRIRITAFNLSSIPDFFRLAWKTGIVMFFFAVSYKFLRWFSPLLFLTLLISSFFLIGVSPFYSVFAMVYGASLILSLLGIINIRAGKGGLLTDMYLFLVMNIGVILGYGYWMKGINIYWETRGM